MSALFHLYLCGRIAAEWWIFMKTKKWFHMAAWAAILALSLTILSGCGAAAQDEAQLRTMGTDYQPGGVLVLTVNPSVEVYYDGTGAVVDVKARNDDGDEILTEYDGYQGKQTRQVVAELIDVIGAAGYFAEEVENEDGTTGRRITIEVEPGSSLPGDTFLADVLADAKKAVEQSQWNGTATNVDYDAEDYLEGKTPVYLGGDELVVFYNQDGVITKAARVDDDKICKVFDGYTGRELRAALLEMVDDIKAAGYYVEEVENEGHRIELDVEKASDLREGFSAGELNALAKESITRAVWADGMMHIDWDVEEHLGTDPEIDDTEDIDDPDDDDLDDDGDDADDLDDDLDDDADDDPDDDFETVD